MKRPNFQEKTEIKVINKDCVGYGQRGKIECKQKGYKPATIDGKES